MDITIIPKWAARANPAFAWQLRSLVQVCSTLFVPLVERVWRDRKFRQLSPLDAAIRLEEHQKKNYILSPGFEIA